MWPTNEEAYAWAEVGRQKRAAHNVRIREEAERENKMKKLKTPSCGAGSSAEPVTDENNPLWGLGNAPAWRAHPCLSSLRSEGWAASFVSSACQLSMSAQHVSSAPHDSRAH